MARPPRPRPARVEFRGLAQPTSITYRPQRLTEKPRSNGPQVAVVVGPPGEEIYTDEYGRVKVQFPVGPLRQ